MSDYTKTLDKAGQAETFTDCLIVNNEKVYYDTVMTFAAEQTRGDITIKAIVLGDGELNLTGNLIIEKSGINAQGFLKQSVLLLSDKAKAVATPKLEIKTDEVRASHSATVGQIDQEQLFYLQSRGLSRKQATDCLVESFLAEVLEILPENQRADKQKQLSKALASI